MGMDYKAMEFELYGLLLQIRELLEDLGETSMKTDIQARLDQIKSKRYNVAVVGEFRRGKSSLINALLGLPVLPADVTPTTATVNRITYGTTPCATIYYKDGTCQELSDIRLLADYVTKITGEQEKMASKVKEAVVYFPAVLCQNHIDIIDTPGLDDDESMTAVTLGMLENIDAAIVTVSALSPFSETEQNFVTSLIAHRGISTLVFVVTFIDQIDEDEYDRVFAGIRKRIFTMTMKTVKSRHGEDPWVMEKAHRILDEMHLYGISAKKALQAFGSNDNVSLEKSRFPIFKEDLYKLLNSWQMIHMMEKGVQSALDALEKLEGQQKSQESALEQERQNLERDVEKIRHHVAGLDRFTDKLLQEIAYDVAKILMPDAQKEEALGRLSGYADARKMEAQLQEDFRQTIRRLEERYALLEERYAKHHGDFLQEMQGSALLQEGQEVWLARFLEPLARERSQVVTLCRTQGEALIAKRCAAWTRGGSDFRLGLGMNQMKVFLWQYQQDAARRMRGALFAGGGKKGAQALLDSAEAAAEDAEKALQRRQEEEQKRAEKQSAERRELQEASLALMKRVRQAEGMKGQEEEKEEV